MVVVLVDVDDADVEDHDGVSQSEFGDDGLSLDGLRAEIRVIIGVKMLL